MRKVVSVIVGILPFLVLCDINGIGLDIYFIILWAAISLFNLKGNHQAKCYLDKKISSGLLLTVFICFNTLVSGYIGIKMIIPWIVVLICVNPEVNIIDKKTIENTILFVSAVASILIVIQTILYYVFSINVSFCPLSLFSENIQEQYRPYHSALMTHIGLFRPCAFFLEPAYFTEYCSIGLAICLFSNRNVKWLTILITVGLLLTTSGLGIIVTVLEWGILSFQGGSTRKNSKILLTSIAIMLTMYIILNRIGAWELITTRFSLEGENSGVVGRMGNNYLVFENAKQYVLFGNGYTKNASYYLTGIYVLIYKIGIVGSLLYLLYLIINFFSSKKEGRIIIGLFIFYLFVANISNISYLTFWLSVGLASQYDNKTNGSTSISQEYKKYRIE